MSTKVTADGDVLVVGINDHGTEVFKLYMNQGATVNDGKEEQITPIYGKFRAVLSDADVSDFDDDDDDDRD